MKKLILSLFLIPNIVFAQQDAVQNVADIALIERRAAENHINSSALGRTLASNNFDVKHYNCQWEVNPSARYIAGRVAVSFQVTDFASSIILDLTSALTVDSIKQNNIALTFNHASDALTINFPTALAISAMDSVVIWYKGIPANSGFNSFVQDSHAGTPVLWSLSEPYGSKDWWPCKNGLQDKADSIDIYLIHPDIYKAASNGLLQSETALPFNKTQTHWKHKYPIVSYLVCFAVTNYTVFNNSVMLGATNLPMVTYCYPESLTSFETNTFKVLEAMQLFHNTFTPYPFINEKYGHVQFGWGGGMEHQTSTFIVTPDESLMAHELGHQWFGNRITCKSWEDIWLNEGFATYTAAYALETKYPAQALTRRQNVLNNITSQPGGMVKVIDTLNVNRVFSGRLSYNKGSYLVFMLRHILGDVVFHNAIRRYLNDPLLAYGNASTADLKRNLEAESGLDLTYFFNQWYAGEGYPTYNVTWNVLDGSCVNINLSQTTSLPASVSFFRMPVQLKFKNATQEATITLDNTINNQNFVRNLGFTPDTVLVDPGLWLISKNNTTTKTADVANGTCGVLSLPGSLPNNNTRNSGAGVVEVYPNPMVEPFTVKLRDFKDKQVAVKVYNNAGQILYYQNIALASGKAAINLPAKSWAKGIYFVKVFATNKTITKRIIK
jgi:aminopeptidase N